MENALTKDSIEDERIAMQLQELIDALDAATEEGRSVESTVDMVESSLIEATKSGLTLPDDCCEVTPEKYARHLVHVGPDKRYSVVAMVWGIGQGTPLHDHAHTWCVECVLEGKIKVTNFRHLGNNDNGTDNFEEDNHIVAGFGEAGHLIPPLEYHTIHNATDNACAITLHVYGGLYNECSIFNLQDDGSYLMERKTMSFDNALCDIPKECQ